MKLKCLAAMAMTTALVGGSANANLLFDIYAGATAGFGGETWFADENESHTAQSYGAVLGIDVPFVRGEVEYDYLTGDDAKLHLVMANVYAKMPTPVIKPYLGAGIGMIVDGEYGPWDAEKTAAYQGMLGVTFDLPVIPFNIDVEGRVLYANEVLKLPDDSADLLHYDARLKLRYVF